MGQSAILPGSAKSATCAFARKRKLRLSKQVSSQSERPSLYYDDDGERRLIFELPRTDRSDLASVTVFALPKSGSVLLDNIMRALCEMSGLTHVSIMDQMFKIGLPADMVPQAASDIFAPKGYCYGGFRAFPRFDIPILKQSRSILLVRDPRDMLVSHYYSVRDSHVLPSNELKSAKIDMQSQREFARSVVIDKYVRSYPAKHFSRVLEDYRTLLISRHDVKIYRYEDVIYNKTAWIADMVKYFGWEIPMSKSEEIGKMHDHIPSEEKSNQHIRQVHPGNYREKLKPETISWLNEYFEDDLRAFGYGQDGRLLSMGDKKALSQLNGEFFERT